jgi:hypothetical protein
MQDRERLPSVAREVRDGATIADGPGIDVVAMSTSHHDAVLSLLVESFSLSEPMAVALRASPADLVPFARALIARCAVEPFSFTALERETGRVIGFSFAHDFVGPALAFDPTPRVVPLFALLARLRARHIALTMPRAGQVIELAATGAAADIARVLERRVLREAAAHGFPHVVRVCTNVEARDRALGEQGMRILDEIDYATFEHEGQKVFADAARHGGAALVAGNTG